jgi:hypothetical protein
VRRGSSHIDLLQGQRKIGPKQTIHRVGKEWPRPFKPALGDDIDAVVAAIKIAFWAKIDSIELIQK